MKSEKWTKAEDEFLAKNYPSNGAKWCANELGRTQRAIQLRRSKLGLKMIDGHKRKTKVKYSKEILEGIVKDCVSYAEVIRAVGLVAQAGNYGTIKNRIAEYQIDVSHFLTVSEISKDRWAQNANNYNVKPLSEILVIDANHNTSTIKKRLFEEGIKKCECELCGQDEMWRGKKMSLILDHKNGIHTDWRLENLQIVCPNCNATLDTHCSKNRKIKGKSISQNEVDKIKLLKAEADAAIVPLVNSITTRPSVEQLLKDLKGMSYVQVGKIYGVADNTVRKWIKKAGVIPPTKNKRHKKIEDKNQIKIEL